MLCYPFTGEQYVPHEKLQLPEFALIKSSKISALKHSITGISNLINDLLSFFWGGNCYIYYIHGLIDNLYVT